ncbi:PepSY-associated TM helix domain-containing protein [Thalassotalea sp. PLHSN55]|uniref:PepSY-associated TM helix domain-containing protein n=1 Tax=Thalassotalea sp. PLHSN55 TaxID=3435888 RepID=UPI003F83C610
MNFRKILFWAHLIAGCSAAIFIFLMSVTGVALTYERQIIQSAERADYARPASSVQTALTHTQLAQKFSTLVDKKPVNIVITKGDGAPVLVKQGRKTLAYLNPYTGVEMDMPGQETKAFMKKLRAFHRWLTLDGSFSQTGRTINGIANITFVILALSGLYLWLPNRFNKRAFKKQLKLSKSHNNKQARNYQWHNVFGFYMAPILIVLAVTAVFFSYKWPGELLKQYATTPEQSLGQPVKLQSQVKVKSTDQHLSMLQQRFPLWQTMSYQYPVADTRTQIFTLDMGNGGEPHKRFSVSVDKITSAIVEQQDFEQLSSYRKIRSYIRFLHTGEVFGLVGQTVAGLASLLACLLVYTGVMLSWRRWVNSRKR